MDKLAMEFNNWMHRTAMAASRHCFGQGNIFSGPEGAKKFGRECGPALLDFGEYGIKHIGSTYSGICVIAYQLRPPVDATDWLAAVREGYERAKAFREGRLGDG